MNGERSSPFDAQAPPGAQAPLGRPRVLVVDDDPTIRLLVRRTLEPSLEVVEAADASVALRSASRELPDLVILDLVLPGRSGFEVLRELRGLSGAESLPVMVLTSLNDLESISKAYDLGATDFLTKPIHWALLPHRTHYLLRSSRAFRELKAWEDHLVHRAEHDPVTGLPNRWLAIDRLKQEVARARRAEEEVVVLFIDLDGFKDVNDRLGHDAGDQLLRSIGRRLRSCLRSSETLARYGGDEFLAILTGPTGQTLAEATTRRLQEAVEEPFVLDGHELRMGFSVGLAVAPTDGLEAEELVRRADRAMYRAKAAGGATSRYFTTVMNQQATERSLMESALSRALEEGELAVLFQPIVELQEGGTLAVEALLRWQTREAGWILPGEFLSTAEESGLMVPISDWVLHTACRRVESWFGADGGPMRLSVNGSLRHLTSPRAVQRIVAVLESAGLAPERLSIEVTEAQMRVQLDGLRAVLRELREMGVEVLLDDFGLGPTSVRLLRSELFDGVKIDRSVVEALPSRDAEMTVRAIVGLARSFELRAIAEGVESEVQRDLLRQVGCDLGQGFLLGRPLEADTAAGRFGPPGGGAGTDGEESPDQVTSRRASSSASSRVAMVPSTCAPRTADSRLPS